jgi:hypothetical protein
MFIDPPHTMTTSFFVSCLISDLTEEVIASESELGLTIPVTSKAIPST